MKRELYEESGSQAISYNKVGYIEYTSDTEEYLSQMHIYKIEDFEGELIETEEMLPAWFDISDLPYEKMWPDARYWQPRVLNDEIVKGRCCLRGHNSIDSFELNSVKHL